MASTLKQGDKAAERGFILWEVLALAIFLSAVAVCLLMYQTAAKAKSDGIHRLTAVYLAQTEFAYLEKAAAAGELASGVCYWLGDAEDLRSNGGEFSVTSEIAVEGADVYLATVRVTWPERGRTRQLALERLFVKRGE